MNGDFNDTSKVNLKAISIHNKKIFISASNTCNTYEEKLCKSGGIN